MDRNSAEVRRAVCTVALIGLDGAGKTTIARRLEQSWPLPAKYLYMGDNADSSNFALPTTRWLWRRRAQRAAAEERQTRNRSPQTRLVVAASAAGSGGRFKLMLRTRDLAKPALKFLGFLNRIAEEWFRQFMAWWYLRQGYLVLFDRHFAYDYYHSGSRGFKRRVHGFLLKHFFPKPQLVIFLDAPAEVVFRRKGEHSVEFLERRRAQYAALKDVIANFAVVNAAQDVEVVEAEVAAQIWRFYKHKQRGLSGHGARAPSAWGLTPGNRG